MSTDIENINFYVVLKKTCLFGQNLFPGQEISADGEESIAMQKELEAGNIVSRSRYRREAFHAFILKFTELPNHA